MKKFFSLVAVFCVLGFSTVSLVHSAPSQQEATPFVQGTLIKIDGPFYVIKDISGKEQRVHVDKNTTIIGKVQPGSKVIAEVTKDGHASALKNVGG